MKKKYRKLPRNTDYSAYRHPRWWPTWIAVSLMWCVSRLPIRVQWWLGKLAGLLALRLAGSRRHIAQVNIRLCFPELTAAQQSALVRNAFIANGIGLLELGIACFVIRRNSRASPGSMALNTSRRPWPMAKAFCYWEGITALWISAAAW